MFGSTKDEVRKKFMLLHNERLHDFTGHQLLLGF